MKQYLKLLLLFVFMPFLVNAYTTDQYYINAELKSNGDLYVEEYYLMNGTYNGSRNTILYKNSNVTYSDEYTYAGYSDIYDGSKITINKIASVNKVSSFDFSDFDYDTFNQTSSATVGDYGVYTNTSVSGGNELMIYMPSSYSKAFYVSYTISNIAVKHNDVGELWWKRFDSSNMAESVADFKIKIKLPNNQNEFRVWAHGQLDGYVTKNGMDEYYAYVYGLNAYQDISFRMTFDKDVIKNSTKVLTNDALDKILAYEESSASEANYEREVYLKQMKEEYISYNNACLEYASHDCYDNLVLLRDSINDDEFLSDYEHDFNTIKNNLIINDRNNATYAVSNAEESLLYSDYESALEYVSILQDEDENTYNNLINRLNSLVSLIKEEENKRQTTALIISLVIGGAAVAIYYVTSTYYSNYKKIYNNEYYREIPDLEPSSVSLLMDGKINSNTVSAEILKLHNNKTLSITPIDNHNYKFSIDHDVKTRLTTGKIRHLLDVIFCYDDEIDLKTLKSNKHLNKYSAHMSDSFDDFKFSAKMDFERENLVIKYSRVVPTFLKVLLVTLGILFLIIPKWFTIPFIICLCAFIVCKSPQEKYYKAIAISTQIVFAIINSFIGIYICCVNNFTEDKVLYIFGVTVLCIIYAILTGKITVYTTKGLEYIGKLEGLKNFLEDFSIIDERELPEVAIWGDYMVYAIVLGVADKLAKVMEVKIKDINPEYTYDPYLYRRFDYIGSNVYNSGVSAHHIETRKQAAASAMKSGGNWSSGGGGSWSSGSGGGGGFSSSSSGGGGGGGIGRF